MLDSVLSISSCVVTVKSSRPWRAVSTPSAAIATALAEASLGIGQVDLGQAVAVEQLHRARRRHEGGVVQVDAEELALRREHADDAELQPADAQPRAERVVGAEEFVLQLAAEHDEAARLFRAPRRAGTGRPRRCMLNTGSASR